MNKNFNRRIQWDTKERMWYLKSPQGKDWSVHKTKLDELLKNSKNARYSPETRLLNRISRGGVQNRQSLLKDQPEILCFKTEADQQQQLEILFNRAVEKVEMITDIQDSSELAGRLRQQWSNIPWWTPPKKQPLHGDDVRAWVLRQVQ